MLKEKPYIKRLILKRDKIDNFEMYPFNIPSIKSLDELEFHEDVTFIVGENGSGKSTILEALALHQGFGLEGGTKNVYLNIHNNASNLKDFITVAKSSSRPTDYFFLRAESLYNVATYMEEVKRSYGDKSLHERSHGEAFIAIAQSLRGNGLYIFDEPEAALSPNRQLALLGIIDDLVKRKSQFIIATHSPILLAYPRAKIIRLDENGIEEVDYQDTEHYQVTKNFLNNTDRMLDLILNE
jgi:predicted ATPase